MKSLIHSEWERLLNKKIFTLVFLIIPVIVFAMANYYSNKNQFLSINDPQYVYVSNFPVLSLIEIFIPFFNMLVMFAVVFSFTEEYRTGQIRLVLLRKYRLVQVFIAKFLVILLYLFLVLLSYYVFSLFIGYFYFEQADSLYVFNFEQPVSVAKSYVYGLKYYILAFVTLICLVTIFIFLSAISYSTTIAVGINFSFLIFSLFISAMLSNTFGEGSLLKYVSIIAIQFTGIAQAISDTGMLLGILSFLCSYIIISLLLSIFYFSKKDFFL
ncbi:ABC-2 family transporter protein [Bacillus cereus]|nr:ABC-2 family transporter protein [Bacillus cereus]